MIQKMSHTTIFVLDQDQAKDFYADKLGFEVKADYTGANGFRWLTVAPKGQSDGDCAGQGRQRRNLRQGEWELRGSS